MADSTITKYLVKINDQLIDCPAEIVGDDEKIRSAFTAFYPEMAGAEVKRSVKDGVQTIDLVKHAGPKG